MAKDITQPAKQPAGHTHQFKPVAAQLKTAVSAQSIKQPVAPPVYRPQATPKAAQPKMATAAVTRKPPVAPPVYRPQQAPKVLQTKTAMAQSLQVGQSLHWPVAPPAYRPLAKEIVQPKAILPARRSPAAPPVYAPGQKKIAEQKKASSPAASTRSVQRQLTPGHYKVNCHANLRAEGNPYKEIDQVKMNSPLEVLDPQGRPSNFKAGWATNEHSWVKVEGKYLLNKSSGGESVHGWINDENLVTAPPPKEKEKIKVEDPVEEDEDAFVAQVRRLYSSLNKGAPPGLSVSVFLRQLANNLAQTAPGTLAYRMNEDAQKSNSLFIIAEGQANLTDRNWAREIVEDQQYRGEYPNTVRGFLIEEPVPVPKKLQNKSMRELMYQ